MDDNHAETSPPLGQSCLLTYNAPLSREAVFVSVREIPGFLRADEASFREWHRQAIERHLQCDRLDRVEYWSTAVAVGDRDWLAEHVKERQLKHHRIIGADNAHYLQGISALIFANAIPASSIS